MFFQPKMSRQTQKRMPKIYVDYRCFVYSVLLKLCACCFAKDLFYSLTGKLFGSLSLTGDLFGLLSLTWGPVWFAIANGGICLARYR